MSTDYRASIFVGLPRIDFEDKELLESLIDSDEIESCPPMYDGGGVDYAVVGIEVYRSHSYCPKELIYDPDEIETMRKEFKSVTGLDAKVWISPYSS